MKGNIQMRRVMTPTDEEERVVVLLVLVVLVLVFDHLSYGHGRCHIIITLLQPFECLDRQFISGEHDTIDRESSQYRHSQPPPKHTQAFGGIQSSYGMEEAAVLRGGGQGLDLDDGFDDIDGVDHCP